MPGVAPVAPTLDDFNRADENPLSDGGAWTGPSSGGLVAKVLSNQAAAKLPIKGSAFWNALSSMTDSEAVIDIGAFDALYDDFNRANENPLSGGGAWQTAGTASAMRVLSNQAQSTSTTVSCASTLTGSSSLAVTDCELHVTLGTITAGKAAGVIARCASGNEFRDCYRAFYDGTGNVVLAKRVGGTQTTLGSAAVTLAAGDKVKLKCTGTTIQAWYFTAGAWTLAASVTDSSRASGALGISSSGTAVDDFTIDSGYDGNNTGPIIRTSNTGMGDPSTRGYQAVCDQSSITLIVQNGTGGNTVLGSYSVALGADDSVCVQGIGTTINVWYRPSGGSWSLVITATDSTWSSGAPGFRCQTSSARVDNFGAGIPAGTLSVPFIGSNTAVNAPQLPIPLPFIASVAQVFAPTLPVVPLPFISSVTAVYAPSVQGDVLVPFISSATLLYPLDVLHAQVDVPFISSHTRVYGVFSLFDPDKTYSGPGNGGETWLVRLAPNGVTETATLAGDIGMGTGIMELTGDSGLPIDRPFVVTIDDEQIFVSPLGAGQYRMRARAFGNTTADSHTAGATVSWGDSYDVAIVAASDIAHSFSADITSSGTFTYYAFLICFDSSQAYDEAGDRYPMHVSRVMGVFDAGAGVSGSNRCDSDQPNAICTPVGVSDDCPAALSNPSMVTTDILSGDVAVVRYTNPEAYVLDLGPRSVALQSWFGLKRVDDGDNDVTLLNPDGYVVDTHPSGPGPGPFDASVQEAWFPAPDVIGIAPDASDAAGHEIDTPSTVPFTTVTMPHGDRNFTQTTEKGWPMCCLAVRQGNKRVPHWQSWDWHDYAYVYAGFGTDDTFCQLLINRNGVVFGSVPSVDLPNSDDIDGPDAVWDDGDYYFAASWYVVLFGGPYIVFGPTIGGDIPPGTAAGGEGFVPGVTFPGGPGGPPTITVPPIEGGSGGDIEGENVGLHVWQTS